MFSKSFQSLPGGSHPAGTPTSPRTTPQESAPIREGGEGSDDVNL